MFISRFFVFSGVIVLAAGCATTPLPPFPPTHPASPEAPEAVAPLSGTRLSADQATRTTNELLKKAAKPSAPSDSMQMPQPHH